GARRCTYDARRTSEGEGQGDQGVMFHGGGPAVVTELGLRDLGASRGWNLKDPKRVPIRPFAGSRGDPGMEDGHVWQPVRPAEFITRKACAAMADWPSRGCSRRGRKAGIRTPKAQTDSGR